MCLIKKNFSVGSDFSVGSVFQHTSAALYLWYTLHIMAENVAGLKDQLLMKVVGPTRMLSVSDRRTGANLEH